MVALTVIFMDVGQGDGALVVFPDNSLILIDCGSIKNSKDVLPGIQAVVSKYVTANNNMINRVIITHPDQDHYNLLVPLFTALPQIKVGEIYYGGDINQYKNGKENNATYNWLRANKAQSPPKTFGGNSPDKKLSRPGVSVYILAANATGYLASSDTNANSIVLLLIYSGVKFFLMGDATEVTEDFIIRSCQASNLKLLSHDYVTALKMGHHGSDTSSSQAWIQALTPDGLFISSDTRSFGRKGTGIPPLSHLKQVIAWSGKVAMESSHDAIVYCDTQGSSDFGKFIAYTTTEAAFTTLTAIRYITLTEYESTGSTFHYVVQPSIQPGGAAQIDVFHT